MEVSPAETLVRVMLLDRLLPDSWIVFFSEMDILWRTSIPRSFHFHSMSSSINVHRETSSSISLSIGSGKCCGKWVMWFELYGIWVSCWAPTSCLRVLGMTKSCKSRDSIPGLTYRMICSSVGKEKGPFWLVFSQLDADFAFDVYD
jgi:hypothetical protein